MEDDPDSLRRLVGTVKMLASEAPLQIKYLRDASLQAKYPVLADDITTEFCCWHERANQLVEEGALSEASLGPLGNLRSMIEAIPPTTEHWTAEALASSSIWANVRDQAKTTLAAMGHS